MEIIYRSLDGKEFATEKECIEHEKVKGYDLLLILPGDFFNDIGYEDEEGLTGHRAFTIDKNKNLISNLTKALSVLYKKQVKEKDIKIDIINKTFYYKNDFKLYELLYLEK